MAEKNGIGFVGNVIVDVVHEVLEAGNLVYSDGYKYFQGDDFETEEIKYSLGGMATNNSVNLGKIGVDYPIRVIGKIGADENGQRIRDTFRENGVPDTYLIETDEHPTSVTEVIYVKDSSGSINRTFRHYFGAMGSFTPEDIDYDILRDMKIVMAGYCLLNPSLDAVDPEYGAVIGRVLEKLRNMGCRTCIDFVTPKQDKWWKYKRFRDVLKRVDILSIGEDQAEGITGITDEVTAVRTLVEKYGVNNAVIHCGDKGKNYYFSEDTGLIIQPIFKVPPEEYAGNTGAGDAFTSGLLHGFHQEWDAERALKFATATAAISLGSLTCTEAMRDESYILEYMETRPTV